MRYNIFSILAKGLLTANLILAATDASWAQGIIVHTTNGQSVNYPAETFSFISPYIREVSSTTYTQGAVATLQYEKGSDLNVARTSHQIFATSAGLVVIGGHTNYVVPTESAELWQNGQWKTVGTNGYAYDTGFSVTLSDGRVMVGGGYSGVGGVGGSTKTCIFNPATQTFTNGPDMNTPRSNCKAITTNQGVYVSGNYGSSSTDASFDFYNGSTFAKAGNTDPYYRPYLFTDTKGNVYTLSTLDNKGNTIVLKTSSSGVTSLYGDKYDAAANKDYYFYYQAYITYMPLVLSADIRTEEYRRTDRNGFLVLTKNAAGNYLLTEPCPDESTTYNHNKFDIPSRHPVTNALITWRGSVYVNNNTNEAYLIGSSGQEGNYTVHVISYNYKDYYWTIASADGFSYDLTTASWTLMADGRLACTGGNTKNDARKDFYIITPPKAGLESSSGTKSYGVDIFKTDGTSDRYMESELASVTTYMPKGDDEQGTWETTTVPQTGGKASKGILTVDFPAGTFSGEAKVSIVEAKQGYVDGDDELSQYYKVKLPGGVYKPFKVAIEMQRLSNEENVCMQFAMMGWASSLIGEAMTYHYLDVTYVDGAYVAEIPAMEAPDDVDEFDVWVGITKCNPVSGVVAARALDGGTGKRSFKLYNKVKEEPKVAEMIANFNTWIPEAINKLEELGFKKPDGCVIECYLVPDAGIWDKASNGEKAGWCSLSYFFKTWATVNFNYAFMSTKPDYENKATIIHELFHYYQRFYDPRMNFRREFEKLLSGSPLILEEASSTWSEKFYNPTPNCAVENVGVFVPCFLPNYKDILAPSTSTSLGWGERFANVGYGASTLLEYLTQKLGNEILLDIWERRKSKSWYDLTEGPYDTKGIIESAANDKGLDIFSQKGYHDFIEALGTGQVYDGITFSNLVYDREVHDTIGVTSRSVKNSLPAYLNNYVYGYGALVEEVEVQSKYNNDVYHGLDGATGLIEQTVDGLTTWVYRMVSRSGITLCGEIRRGQPMRIQPEWFLKTGNPEKYASQRFIFVTIADDFKAQTERLSRIVARVMNFDIPQKQVTVPNNFGIKSVKFSSNCYDLKLKSNADWLTCFWSSTDSTLRVTHEQMPENLESRKATIQVIVNSDDGTEMVYDELEITQSKAFIELSTTDIKVDVNGGTKEINITSTNCTDLKVDTRSLFLHPTINGNIISVKIDPNTSYDVREGSVIVSGIMPTTGVKVERFISFTQAAAPSPDAVNLYDDGFIQVLDNKVNIPGKTLKYGDYLLYRSKDTQVEKYDNGSKRQEFSWDVNIYIDPKDNKSMRHYEFYSGSVTWLLNRYWTSKDKDGLEIEHQETTRCSYNLKDLKTTDGLEYYSVSSVDNDETIYKLSDFISDYSYEVTLDGKPTQTVMQADIANQRIGYKDAWVNLRLADGVPYLEADRDSINFHGGETFEILQYDKNEAVQSVQITTSADWMFIDRTYHGEYKGYYYINTTINTSKAPRTGFVYITGTMADGSKLTRTVVVTQEYDPAWDDEREWSEDQKPELPSQAVLDALQAHGMPIYLGNEPPHLRGTYIMEPLHTVYETNSESGESAQVDCLVFNFSSIAGKTDRAAMSYYSHLVEQNINTAASDYLCYFGGYSDFFTLSNIQEIDYGIFKFSMVTVITGEIDNGNIKNLYFAHVDLDEDGTIENISIGTDGDGICPTTIWEPGGDSFSRALRHTIPKVTGVHAQN